MSDSSQNAAGAAGERTDFDRLVTDISAAKDDIANLSREIADAVSALADLVQTQTKRGLKNAQANVNSLMSDASERVQTVAGATHDAVASIGDTLEDAIQERPLASVAIALGLGFLIGVTWRR